MSGTIEDGAELNQVYLAEQFKVSRVPVREALLRLEAEGLVVAKPFHRYVVGSLTPAEILELTDIREELEAFALRGLAGEVTDAYIEELRLAADQLKPSADVATWIEADRAFHRLLFPDYPMTRRLVDDIRVQIHRYLRQAIRDAPRREQVLKEHAAIVDAIERGDLAQGESALRQHIRGTRALLERKLEATGRTGATA